MEMVPSAIHRPGDLDWRRFPQRGMFFAFLTAERLVCGDRILCGACRHVGGEPTFVFIDAELYVDVVVATSSVRLPSMEQCSNVILVRISCPQTGELLPQLSPWRRPSSETVPFECAHSIVYR